MKKLKLKLDGDKMLSKEQMKKISGGYSFTCYCEDGRGTIVGYCNSLEECIECCDAFCYPD